MARLTARWCATDSCPRAALRCVVAALVGVNAVGCTTSHPRPAPNPSCVRSAGQTSRPSLTLSYQDAPTLRVTPGKAVTVIVPAYAHQPMVISSSGDPRVACLATTHRRADGSVQATFVALRTGTSTISGSLAHATRAMMPAIGGTLVVHRP
jgi:hypothetical protein